MCSPGINGGELRGQPANTGSPGKMAIKTECMCVHRQMLGKTILLGGANNDYDNVNKSYTGLLN